MIPSPEALRAAEQSLEAAGIIYQDPLFSEWHSAAGEPLSQAEVDALCVAALTSDAKTKQASSSLIERDKRRGGRPAKAASEKLKCVSVMVTPGWYDEVHAKAGELGLSVSNFLRPLVEPQLKNGKSRFTRRFEAGLSVEERKLLRQVAGMSGNLNQLAKLAHTGGCLRGNALKLEAFFSVFVR